MIAAHNALVGRGVSSEEFVKKIKISSWILLLTILCGQLSYAQSGRKKIVDGNKLYGEERYDEAMNKYRDAQVHAPESPIIKFNMGNVNYKKQKYEESIKEFEGSLGADEALAQSQAYYNIGNSLYRLGKLPESILAYQEALKLNPDDQDAKYNLEFVRRQLKDQSEKQQNQNEQQQNQQQQQQQQQNQEQQDQQGDEQEQAPQESQEESEQQEQQQQQQQQEMQTAEEMSKEDAERILQAMKEDEENMKNARKQRAPGNVRVLKDW
ncbi:tetratricopeptide repeat protein [candidate division KSB1 bacterium]|nr:MAG: tetratricopeptide repeat protein [candidate division KSB1 bacterium]